MATQDEILTLEQMKGELRYEADEQYFDSLLTQQIADSISFVETFTGLKILGGEGLEATDPRLGTIRRAVILLTRDSFDGKAELRPNAAVYAMLRPIRIARG